MAQKTGKDALLWWCQEATKGYKGVSVTNFHTSWGDGLAFCAILHRYHPDRIPYDKLTKENPSKNLDLAFKVGEDIGIPALLDVEDMLIPKPEQFSVMTYLSQYFHRFVSEGGGAGIASVQFTTSGLQARMPKAYEAKAEAARAERSRMAQGSTPGVSGGSQIQRPQTTQDSGLPVCVACSERISGDVLKWGDADYHPNKCLRCNNCAAVLSSAFVKKIGNDPHCQICFDKMMFGGPKGAKPAAPNQTPAKTPVSTNIPPAGAKSAKLCAKCQLPLRGNVIEACSTEWHEKCFGCTTCGKSLQVCLNVNGKACGRKAFSSRTSVAGPPPSQTNDAAEAAKRMEQQETEQRERKRREDEERRKLEEDKRREEQRRREEDEQRRRDVDRRRQVEEEERRLQVELQRKKQQLQQEEEERRRKQENEHAASLRRRQEEEDRKRQKQRDEEDKRRAAASKQQEILTQSAREDERRRKADEDDRRRKQDEDEANRLRHQDEERRREIERKRKETEDRLNLERQSYRNQAMTTHTAVSVAEATLSKVERERMELEAVERNMLSRNTTAKALAPAAPPQETEWEKKVKQMQSRRQQPESTASRSSGVGSNRDNEEEARKKREEEDRRQAMESKRKALEGSGRSSGAGSSRQSEDEAKRRRDEEEREREEALRREKANEKRKIEDDRQMIADTNRKRLEDSKKRDEEENRRKQLEDSRKREEDRARVEKSRREEADAARARQEAEGNRTREEEIRKKKKEEEWKQAADEKRKEGERKREEEMKRMQEREELERKRAESMRRLEANEKVRKEMEEQDRREREERMRRWADEEKAQAEQRVQEERDRRRKWMQDEEEEERRRALVATQAQAIVPQLPVASINTSPSRTVIPVSTSPGRDGQPVSPGRTPPKPLPPTPVMLSRVSSGNGSQIQGRPSSPTNRPPTLEGYLEKQDPGGFKVWRKRWFSLVRGEQVVYWETAETAKPSNPPLGTIILDIVSVLHVDETSGKWQWEMDTPDRTFYLRAPDMETRDRWVQTLRQALQALRAKRRPTMSINSVDALKPREGWLYLQGGLLSLYSWGRVYVTLRNGFLFWAKQPGARQEGKAALYRCQFEDYRDTSYPAGIRLVTSSKEVFMLAANNPEELATWIQTIWKQKNAVEEAIDNISL